MEVLCPPTVHMTPNREFTVEYRIQIHPTVITISSDKFLEYDDEKSDMNHVDVPQAAAFDGFFPSEFCI